MILLIVGHITLCVARDLHPKKAVGLDIDPKLIKIARKNVQHYKDAVDCLKFPESFSKVYGPLSSPELPGPCPRFPQNVSFLHVSISSSATI